MKKNKRNTDRQMKDIIRYLENRMTRAERNAFERKLQSDPFLAEAMEGYSEIENEDINSDIRRLKERLQSRTRRRSTLLYRVAAAMVILIGISSVLLVRNLRQPDMRMAEGRDIFEDMASDEKMPDPSEAKPVVTEEIEMGKQERKEIPAEKSMTVLKDNNQDSIPETRLAIPELIVEYEIIPETDTVDIVKAIPEKAREVEDVSRISGIAAGKETLRKSVSRKEVVATLVAAKVIDRTAQPITGEEEYNKYLAEKQVYPVGYQKSEPVEIILKLIIEEDGSIGKIEIQESPDKQFSDEAIRLVWEGPAWQPAMKEGQAVRDTLNLKIIFKLNDGEAE